MKSITLELNIVENGQTVGFKRCLQNRYTSLNGFIIKEIKEKLGFKSRSAAQTFFENELLCGEKTSRPARKAQRKRAKTLSLKSGKRPKTTLERVGVLQNFFNVKNSF